MLRDHYLDINKITSNPHILELFRIIENHGGALRFVGGCVRDAIKGIKGFDLDLATDLSPDELVEICEENNLKTIPIGIKFGTVGILIDNQVLEVTSLRRDIKTDGRRAEVEFTSDWNEDASRRDLTINAVYADDKGNVFDYYNGIEDLESGRVRFIGNPTHRIKEDYLRILRFFRFYSIFGQGEIDQKALTACKENKEGLRQLSMERIRDEMSKILVTPNVVQTLKIMYENDILSYLLPDSHNFDQLDFLVNTIDVKELPNASLRRLFVLYNPDQALAENLAARLKMSKKQRDDFVSWSRFQPQLEDFLQPQTLQKLVYLYGNEFCRDKLILLCSLDQKILPDMKARLDEIMKIKVPSFQLKGRDVIAAGIKDNRQIGKILDKLEQIWIDSGFSLSTEELLNRLPQLIAEKSA